MLARMMALVVSIIARAFALASLRSDSTSRPPLSTAEDEDAPSLGRCHRLP